MNKRSLFIGLQVADLLSTLACFHVGLREMNAVNLWFIAHFGLYGGLLVSKALACGLVYLRPWKKLWALNGFYALIVIWNVFLFGVFGLANAL